MMGYRERRERYEQQLRALRNRGFGHMLLRKGILEFGVWIGGVLMALTLVREYFATGLSARIFVASLLGGVVAAVVGGAVFGALAWRQSGRMEKTSPV
jgi:hypothetical protein